MKPNFTINFITVWKLFKRYILGKKPAKVRNFGLKRDKPDPRDILYKVRAPGLAPESTEMRNFKEFQHIYDQGSLGSCVGNAACSAFRRVLQVNKQPDFEPSRLFAYYNARSEDNKAEDSGASIRDAIKGIAKYGVCSESLWPYIISKFSEKPSVKAFLQGLDHQAIHYERLPQTKEVIMDAVSRGYPVVYGKMLYESFMSEEVAKTGKVPYPKTCWDDSIGGHAMAIFDYDKEGTIEPNSWSKAWGLGGLAHVPWKYVLNPKLCFDFWVIYIVEAQVVTNKKRK